HAAGLLDLAGDQLAEVLQVHVAVHELGEGVGDGDDRLLEVFVLHPGGAPQGAGAGHVAAVGGGFRAVIGHDGVLLKANRRGTAGRIVLRKVSATGAEGQSTVTSCRGRGAWWSSGIAADRATRAHGSAWMDRMPGILSPCTARAEATERRPV